MTCFQFDERRNFQISDVFCARVEMGYSVGDGAFAKVCAKIVSARIFHADFKTAMKFPNAKACFVSSAKYTFPRRGHFLAQMQFCRIFSIECFVN